MTASAAIARRPHHRTPVQNLRRLTCKSMAGSGPPTAKLFVSAGGFDAPWGNPAFCKRGSDHPSAKVFPLEKSARQVAMLDPKTMKYSFINTCFATHHLQFGYDANDTLWLSGTGPVAGWINTKMFDETGDAAKSQAWSPFVLDTNGNGKRDDYVEPNAPLDPSKDKRIVPGSGPYAVMPSPVDGSIWDTVGICGGTPR